MVIGRGGMTERGPVALGFTPGVIGFPLEGRLATQVFDALPPFLGTLETRTREPTGVTRDTG